MPSLITRPGPGSPSNSIIIQPLSWLWTLPIEVLGCGAVMAGDYVFTTIPFHGSIEILA